MTHLAKFDSFGSLWHPLKGQLPVSPIPTGFPDLSPPVQLAGYIALLVALCWISFNGVVELGFEGDDQQYIADAESVLDGSGTLFSTGRVFSGRPVVEVVFLVSHFLWGRSTVAYHVLAVLLHLCASLLTVRILIQLGVSRRVSAVAGILFTVGVPHYQVVHWVSGIAYSVYYSLRLLSIGTFVSYLKDRKPARLAIGTVLLALAVFSHASAIAFVPFAVFLIWYLQYALKSLVQSVILYALGAILPFVMTLFFYGDAMTSHGTDRAGEFGRIAISWCSYYGSTFLTSHLLLYPSPPFSDPLSAGIGVVMIILLVVAVLCRSRVPLLALVCSLLMVAPFIATFFLRIQPRYLYAASLGASLLGAWIFAENDVLGENETRWTRILRHVAGIVVIVLSVSQLRTAVGVTHARDGRSLASGGQPEEGVKHYLRGHEIAGHLYTSDDYVRLTKAALYVGTIPDRILTYAVTDRYPGDRILEAMLGVSKFAFANTDSQVSGARIISDAINRADRPNKVARNAAGGLYNVGVRFYNAKQYLRAARVSNNVLELDASRWDARHLKAKSYLHYGEPDSAAQAYESLLNQAERGGTHRDVVVSALEEAVRTDGKIGVYWALLARAYAIEGYHLKALQAIRRAINQAPENSKLWSEMGNYAAVLVGEHPDQRPSEVLREIVEPSDEHALLFVARLYARLGDRPASRELYRQLLRVDPDNRQAQEALAGSP